jgi:hypothetical protein
MCRLQAHRPSRTESVESQVPNHGGVGYGIVPTVAHCGSSPKSGCSITLPKSACHPARGSTQRKRTPGEVTGTYSQAWGLTNGDAGARTVDESCEMEPVVLGVHLPAALRRLQQVPDLRQIKVGVRVVDDVVQQLCETPEPTG